MLNIDKKAPKTFRETGCLAVEGLKSCPPEWSLCRVTTGEECGGQVGSSGPVTAEASNVSH